MNLASPQGTKALVGIPRKRAWQSVMTNTTPVWNNGTYLTGVTGVSGAGEDSLYIKFNVDPGAWRFTASLDPVGVSERPEQVPSNLYSVKIRKTAGSVAFGQEFAGMIKMVRVYDLSGRLVFSNAVIKNNVNLQKDFCLPDNVYVVEMKTVR
jgi:hypothetical protein